MQIQNQWQVDSQQHRPRNASLTFEQRQARLAHAAQHCRARNSSLTVEQRQACLALDAEQRQAGTASLTLSLSLSPSVGSAPI